MNGDALLSGVYTHVNGAIKSFAVGLPIELTPRTGDMIGYGFAGVTGSWVGVRVGLAIGTAKIDFRLLGCR